MTKLEQLPLTDAAPLDPVDPHGGIMLAGESGTPDTPLSPLAAIDKAYAQHYENASLSRRALPRCVLSRTKPPVPAELHLPQSLNADGFAILVKGALKEHYGAKTHIVDLADGVSSDNKCMTVDTGIRSFAQHYKNPFLLMIESGDSQLLQDEQQVTRREQIRGTIAELLLPSLSIVSFEPVQMN